MNQHRIVRQTAVLHTNVSEDRRDVSYNVALLLRDKTGHEHVFLSKRIYKFDETGRAHCDLACVAAANFNDEQ